MMSIKRIAINSSVKPLVVVAGMLALPAFAAVEVTNSVPTEWAFSAVR